MHLNTLIPVSVISRRALTAIAAIALTTPFCHAQNPSAIVSIQLDKPLHTVSPTLYGLMTEEIN
jgi:alpha-N-arabinofuranosidase